MHCFIARHRLRRCNTTPFSLLFFTAEMSVKSVAFLEFYCLTPDVHILRAKLVSKIRKKLLILSPLNISFMCVCFMADKSVMQYQHSKGDIVILSLACWANELRGFTL